MASTTRSTLALAAAALACVQCFEPPPKIAAIPATGFAVRLQVFGAAATEAERTFAAVKDNNPSFSLVDHGGDGEILVGLDNISPRCVAPVAMCSFRVSYRVKNDQGDVIDEQTTTVDATSDRCSSLCSAALRKVAVQVVERAVADLHGDPRPAPMAALKTASRPLDPPMCSVGHGARLPADDAETRAAQVEALHRLGSLDRTEYDCLRRAYLERL